MSTYQSFRVRATGCWGIRLQAPTWFPWGLTVTSLQLISRAPSSSGQESFVLSWHSCSETGNVNFDQCLPAWRAAGPMARSTLAEVRRLFTFPEAKAGVDPKNTKISYAAVLIRKRLKKAAAASFNLTKKLSHIFSHFPRVPV